MSTMSKTIQVSRTEQVVLTEEEKEKELNRRKQLEERRNEQQRRYQQQQQQFAQGQGSSGHRLNEQQQPPRPKAASNQQVNQQPRNRNPNVIGFQMGDGGSVDVTDSMTNNFSEAVAAGSNPVAAVILGKNTTVKVAKMEHNFGDTGKN